MQQCRCEDSRGWQQQQAKEPHLVRTTPRVLQNDNSSSNFCSIKLVICAFYEKVILSSCSDSSCCIGTECGWETWSCLQCAIYSSPLKPQLFKRIFHIKRGGDWPLLKLPCNAPLVGDRRKASRILARRSLIGMIGWTRVKYRRYWFVLNRTAMIVERNDINKLAPG